MVIYPVKPHPIYDVHIKKILQQLEVFIQIQIQSGILGNIRFDTTKCKTSSPITSNNVFPLQNQRMMNIHAMIYHHHWTSLNSVEILYYLCDDASSMRSKYFKLFASMCNYVCDPVKLLQFHGSKIQANVMWSSALPCDKKNNNNNDNNFFWTKVNFFFLVSSAPTVWINLHSMNSIFDIDGFISIQREKNHNASSFLKVAFNSVSISKRKKKPKNESCSYWRKHFRMRHFMRIQKHKFDYNYRILH